VVGGQQLYVKGLSLRDISERFRYVLEDEGVSLATATRVPQTIQTDFEA
jgi:hypothetical protein